MSFSSARIWQAIGISLALVCSQELAAQSGLFGSNGSGVPGWGASTPGGSCSPIFGCTAPPAMCLAPPGGDPSGGGNGTTDPGGTCGVDQPATLDTGSGSSSGAGNPINVATGNKYQREVDMAPLPGVLGLEIVRHYNSSNSGQNHPYGLVGRGWRLSYETVLYPVGNTVQVVQADGSRIIFSRQRDNRSVCSTDNPALGEIVISKQGQSETYTWVWRNGRRLRFDGRGKLTQIQAPTGEFVTLTYDRVGHLLSVEDPQGRRLTLSYPEKADRHGSAPVRFAGVQAIDSPLGRFTYTYGSSRPAGSQIQDVELIGNLVSVGLPEGPDDDANPSRQRQRLYHYEDPLHPTLLTGISQRGVGSDGQARTERLSHYAYDARGWAVRSERQGDVIELAAMERAGARQDKEGPSGLAVLVHSKSASRPDGHQLRVYSSQIGGYYRVVRTEGVACPASLNCPPANVRYRYDTQGRVVEQTTLDARGKTQHSLRAQYDAWGRVVRMSRHVHRAASGEDSPRELAMGYVRYEYPAPATGEAPSPHPIVVARPSVVAGKEHQIRFGFNERGQVTERIESGYSPLSSAKRPATRSDLATSIQRVTRYQYSMRNGRSVLTAIDGPLPGSSDTVTVDWDERGAYRRAMHMPLGLQHRWTQRDGAGRVTEEIAPDGVTTRYTYGPDSTPASWQRGPARVQVSFDAFGRPERIALPDGEVRKLAYVPDSPAVAWATNRGETGWVRPPSRPAAWPSTPAPEHEPAPSPTTAVPWAQAQAWVDDFGRVVAIQTRETGLEIRAYDAQDRLQQRTLADGSTWTWDRDALGRVVSHTVQAPGAERIVTRLRYEGTHLARVDHPLEQEDHLHDAWGRLVQRTLHRPGQAGQAALTTTERFAYDAADRLVSWDLAEGGRLRYEWGVGRQLHAIHHEDGHAAAVLGETITAWLGAGRRTLIAPLPDTGSTRGYRWGNGVALRWQLNDQGQLAQMRWEMPSRRQAEQTAWLTGWLASAHAANETPSRDASLLMATAFSYDAHGLLHTRTEDTRRVSYGYDRLGRLIWVEPQQDDAREAPTETSQPEYYSYDAAGRLQIGRWLGADHDWRGPAITRDATGLPQHLAPASGQPERWVRHSADRRLVEVRQAPAGTPSDAAPIMARYAHNAHGLRIGKTVFAQDRRTERGRHTQYLWQGMKLVAETVPEDAHAAGAARRVARRYVYAHQVPVAVIDYPDGAVLSAPSDAGVGAWLHATWRWLASDRAKLGFVHANEIGTPVAVTDEQARVIWRARPTAYGVLNGPAVARTAHTPKGFALNLRLPGQYFDEETGWHDNVLRTYDPQRAAYLEPDPLGPLPNWRTGRVLTQPYAYANHNPVSFADPTGLILFAFDGTGNDQQSRTNVWEFAQAYNDFNAYDVASGLTGTSFYIQGVGTMGGVWDNAVTGGALAIQLRDRINDQLSALDQYVTGYYGWETDRRSSEGLPTIDSSGPLQIQLDITGFSRGAAASREFANQIVDRIASGYYDQLVKGCVQLTIRGMWLFDTVLSSNTSTFGAAPFRMVIPDEVQHVAHAVAVNEYRALFPLETIAPSEPTFNSGNLGGNRIERSFIGAHSDVGGGYNCASGCDGGDLSDVALNWMVQQAQAAGVVMNPLRAELTVVTNPLVHDESRAPLWRTPGFGGLSSDRDVRFRGTDRSSNSYTTSEAKTLAYGGGMNYTQSLTYIDYDELGLTDLFETTVGQVKLCGHDGYLAWVQAQYGVAMSCP